MIEFTIIHDRISNPDFPYKTLEQFPFINLKTEHVEGFRDEITITIHKEHPDITQEEIYKTIFSLGRLVGQAMYMNYCR
jgi:hypothetical protein